MINNNFKRIIKAADTVLLAGTMMIFLSACGDKNTESYSEISQNVVAVNSGETDSIGNKTADNVSGDISVHNEEAGAVTDVMDITDDNENVDKKADENVSDSGAYDLSENENAYGDSDDNGDKSEYWYKETYDNMTSDTVEDGSDDTHIEENVIEEKHKTTICIDAGHGGSNEGTKETYDGKLIKEKDINLIIAKKLQQYLAQNDNLNVIMTRNSDTDVSIDGRIEYAKSNNADYVISVHINSKSQDNTNPRGCMVLMSCSSYQPSDSRFSSIYNEEQKLAASVISNLNSIGIPIADDWNTEYTNGILQRTNTVNERYPDGSLADYYGLIYNGTYAGIPTIIIEHSFLSNENDYRTHFSTEAQLDELARADSQGIMAVVGR